MKQALFAIIALIGLVMAATVTEVAPVTAIVDTKALAKENIISVATAM